MPEGLASSAAVAGRVAVLDLEALRAATGGFASARKIGSGGFGKVFCADAISSLPPPLRRRRLAVKRAKVGLEPADLAREITLLQAARTPQDTIRSDLIGLSC